MVKRFLIVFKNSTTVTSYEFSPDRETLCCLSVGKICFDH